MWKPRKILTLNTKTNTWTKTEFNTFNEYRQFIVSQFKEPGQYNFQNTELWRSAARKFETSGKYCDYHPTSKEYKDFWLTERRKCEQGIIADGIYISGNMYFFWNYCMIPNKLEGKETFPEPWDGHYHLDLYCELAELFGQDVAGSKSRQKGISLYLVARLARKLWFGNKDMLKIISQEEEYVLGEWGILNGYRNHLNNHTGWYRMFSPDESLNWEQKRLVTEGTSQKKATFKGNFCKIKGLTTKMNVTKAVGGCHAKGDQVYTTEGLKNIEDIRIGDYVFGKEGLPKKVIDLHTGTSKIYEIQQTYGESYFVIGSHLLHLTTNNKRFKEKDINITVEDYLERSKDRWFKRSYSGVKVNSSLVFPEKQINIDPYLLGLWLGDGYSACAKIIVNNTKDSEILDFLKNNSFGQSTNFKRKEANRYNDEMYLFSYTQSKTGRRDNHFFNSLKNYNLIKNKHIPEDYIYNTEEVRLQLLAGIIDTDGTYSKKRNEYEISSKYKCFLEQIQLLCTTLGMYSSIRQITSKEHFIKTKLIRKSTSFILRIIVPEGITVPCKVKRKQTISKTRRQIRTPIEIIDTGRTENYYGFECENHLYVLKDGTITHNSAKEIYVTEAGINKRLIKIKEFVDPNMKMGNVKTGMFIAMGAAGDLGDAQDLMLMSFNPKGYNIRPIKSYHNGVEEETAFFFPEEWNYTHQDENTGEIIKCYDVHGNSDIELAIKLIQQEDERQKSIKDSVSYRLWKSQHPRTLRDAFDQREDNPFPTDLLKEQEKLVIGEKPIIVSLERDFHGKITHKFCDDVPISKIKPNPNENNKGAIVVYEFPIDKPPFGLYYAGIDPIYNLDTSTSTSLMAISVWIGTHERDGKIVEPYPVCQYIGRHRNVRDTYEQCLKIIEWYNARTAVESNVKDFTEWVIRQGKARFLMRRRELTVINELTPNSTVRDEIGVRMIDPLKTRALEKVIAWLQLPIATSFDLETGESKDVYNVSKIKDAMWIKEMLQFNPKLNTDRLVANLLALLAVQSDTNRHIITGMKNPFKQEPKKLITKLPSSFVTQNTQGHFKKLKSHFG